MQKQVFLETIAEALKIEPRPYLIAKELGISGAAVIQWPDPISRRVAQFVVGDFIRIGRRPPAKLVQFIRGQANG